MVDSSPIHEIDHREPKVIIGWRSYIGLFEFSSEESPYGTNAVCIKIRQTDKDFRRSFIDLVIKIKYSGNNVITQVTLYLFCTAEFMLRKLTNTKFVIIHQQYTKIKIL